MGTEKSKQSIQPEKRNWLSRMPPIYHHKILDALLQKNQGTSVPVIQRLPKSGERRIYP
jgi:hypothetical protein